MFDTLFTIAMTASAAAVIAFLSYALAGTPRGRLTVAVALVAWFAVVVALGATRLLGPDRLGTPALGLAVVAPVATLVVLFALVHSIRNAALAVPLPALVAINSIRVLGLFFRGAFRSGEASGAFAPAAGWGDIAIGVAALPLAGLIARFGGRVRPLTLLWNSLGFLDLVDAIALGVMSSPGPLQVFVGPPTSALMTTLPWLLIPAFLVPALFFTHIVVFVRSARTEAFASAGPWGSARAAART